MAWHVLTSTYFDFDQIAVDAKADLVPEHLAPMLADDLNARLHQPLPESLRTGTALIDRLGSLLYGRPEHWELARRVYKQLEPGDCVYATGCDAGVPFGLLCALRRPTVPVALAMIDPRRFRSTLTGWILGLTLRSVLLIVPTSQQVDEVRDGFGRHMTGVVTIEGQTDCQFFRPGRHETTRATTRETTLVASCGAEQRDYETLARAIGNSTIEVKVCLASPNLSSKTRYTMPDPSPANFEFRYFPFDELRDLYQNADVVVIPLLENGYSAGLTSIFEAIACESPVVTTRSVGLINDLIDRDLVVGVAPGDALAMRRAIDDLLSGPVEARRRARAARNHVLRHYSSDRFRQNLQHHLVGFLAAVEGNDADPVLTGNG